MNSRERILGKIRTALQTPIDTPIPKPLLAHDPFVPLQESVLEIAFAEQLRRNGGDFFFCQHLEDFLLTLKRWLAYRQLHVLYAEDTYLRALLDVAEIRYEQSDLLWEQAEAALVLAEMLVADTGSIILSSRRASGRRWQTYPPVQLVVAFSSQILPTLQAAIAQYQQQHQANFPSMWSLITAPSQTADIERTLVMGAHGPKELVVFLIDEAVENEE